MAVVGDSGGKAPLKRSGVNGMHFAFTTRLVDAMIGRPHVVTMGVREQVVKPATKFAGPFAMNSFSHFPIDTASAQARNSLLRSLPAVILAIGHLMLGIAPLHAGSATAKLGVTARVIDSFTVSADAIASQAAGASGILEMNRQPGTAARSLSDSTDSDGVTLPSRTANVSYSVEEVPGSGGALKIITINF